MIILLAGIREKVMQTSTDIEKYIDKIKNILIFKPLNKEELANIATHIEIIELEEDELIVKEGDLSPSFFAVLDGTVSVTVRQDEQDVYLCSIGAGDIFGEAAMFLKVKRTATVKSTGPAVVVKMLRHELLKTIKSMPVAGNKILLLMIFSLLKKLRESNQELAYERRVDIAQDDVDALIAEFST